MKVIKVTEKFNNTTKLTTKMFKREWLTSTIWLVVLIGITLMVANIFSDLYGTPAERMGMAETMSNPAMVAMIGPAYGLDNYTNGVMYAQMMILFSILAVAIMNIFLVVRYTRKDEESGRFEVIKSLPVGKLSDLGATMIVCFVVNLALALITGFGLYALNLESMDLTGSLLYGVTLGVSGLFFGTIAALFAQISSTSRGAITYSAIILGVAYLIRAIGDVSAPLLSLFSPLGLPLKTEIYYNNNLWPVFVLLFLSIIITIIAFRLNSTRDLGAGLIAAKPGKKEASNFLKTPTGLTLRLIKGILIGWGVGVFVLGIAYGSVFGDVETFLEGSELMQQLFLGNDKFTFAEQFLTTLMVISSIMVTVPTLSVLLKIRTEEKKGRLEHIYSKKISRKTIFSNYLTFSFLTSIIMTIAFVFGLWIAAVASMDDPIALTTIFASGISYLPAIWSMIGIAALLIAFIPKLTNQIWSLLGLFFFFVYIGPLMNIPNGFLKATPYGSIARIPVEDINFVPLIILTVLTIVMTIVAIKGYNKRDITDQ